MNRGEVRLVSFRSPDKVRPAVVLTNNASLPHLTWVTVAPITSTIRDLATQVVIDEGDGMKHPCAVNLHNIVTVPKTFVGSYVARLNASRMREICAAMNRAL